MKWILLVVISLLFVGISIGDTTMGNIKNPPIQGVDPRLNYRFMMLEKNLNKLISDFKGIGVESIPKSTLPESDQYSYSTFVPSAELVDGSGQPVDEDGSPLDITRDSKIGGTLASYVVSMGYYKNLLLSVGPSPYHYQWTVTATYLGLTDANSNIIGLMNVGAVCDISIAGPVIGGRDQAVVFVNQWIYLYMIYNPSTKVWNAIASASYVSPTLPSGYTYWFKCGPAWVDNNGYIDTFDATQINNKVYYRLVIFQDHAYSGSGWDEESIPQNVPPTALSIFGQIGTSANSVSARGISIASSNTGQHAVSGTVESGAVIYNPRSAIWFDLPLIVSQKLYWQASTSNAYFYATSKGFVDDI